MTNYKHISITERDIIQQLTNLNYNFSDIAKIINVDRTTISKKIKRNRYLKYIHYLPHSKSGITKAVKSCSLLSKPPYVCNKCKNKSSCTKPKLYYNSKIAQERYDEIKVSSRSGFNISEEEIDVIEKSIIPLIKNKKHSINQIYINNKDMLYFSKTTCYRYIDKGVFSISNINLPRKVKYKPRKEKK